MRLVELRRLVEDGPSVALYEALTRRRLLALLDVARAAQAMWPVDDPDPLTAISFDEYDELRVALDELDFALLTPIEDVVVTTGVL